MYSFYTKYAFFSRAFSVFSIDNDRFLCIIIIEKDTVTAISGNGELCTDQVSGRSSFSFLIFEVIL